MERLREMINISFLQLEQILFQELRKEFCEAFSALLERLDDQIHSACDKNRYEVLEKVSRGVETLVGTVRFRRRCYLDRQMKKRVYCSMSFVGFLSAAGLLPVLPRWQPCLVQHAHIVKPKKLSKISLAKE